MIMTDPNQWQFYYDPIATQVIRQSSSAIPDPLWKPLTPEYAQMLSTGIQSGGQVYLNTAGWPVLHSMPTKPHLRWDEEAVLTPVSVIDGVAHQEWRIKKMSIPEKLMALAAFRFRKQHSLPFKMAIAKRGAADEKIYKDCITDQGTVYMMTQSGLSATRRADIVFPHWKFDVDGSIEWHAVNGVDLLEAWDEASEKIEEQFSIEAMYTVRILQGIEVDITEWTLLPPLVAAPTND